MTIVRTGIIGANPEKGWGSSVHIPVISRLPGFELTAVCTTRMESARRSAEQYGAGLAFDDPAQMVANPDVDLVVIAVKAPDHHRLAMMALEAGKHVYCEWPLAATVQQAAEMAELAARRKLRAMVGLQSRGAPALRYVRNLIAQGYVGRVISVRMNCALPGGGARRSQEGLYVIRKDSGASTLAIQGGHAIDALQFCVGKLANFSSVVANQFAEIEVIETGERLAKDAPDQILLSGCTESGAVVSVAINGGVVAGHGIAIDIFGDQGTLSVRGAGGLNFQMSELELLGARLPDRALSSLEIPAGYDPQIFARDEVGRPPYPGVSLPRATLVNVANLYHMLGDAIRGGVDPEPGFDHGLNLHHLLDKIDASSGSIAI